MVIWSDYRKWVGLRTFHPSPLDMGIKRCQNFQWKRIKKQPRKIIPLLPCKTKLINFPRDGQCMLMDISFSSYWSLRILSSLRPVQSTSVCLDKFYGFKLYPDCPLKYLCCVGQVLTSCGQLACIVHSLSMSLNHWLCRISTLLFSVFATAVVFHIDRQTSDWTDKSIDRLNLSK